MCDWVLPWLPPTTFEVTIRDVLDKYDGEAAVQTPLHDDDIMKQNPVEHTHQTSGGDSMHGLW